MELKQSIKEAHKNYYQGVDGPIGGRERFEWVAASFFSGTRGRRILEIGCGEGSLLEMLKPHNEVHGVDISETGVQKTRQKGIDCHHADASNETLPFSDGFFDVVITLETIEHVENPHRMLWEIKRVLKEGGLLLISIPGEKVYHPFIYPGLFTRRNFSEFLASNGFPVTKVAGWGQAPLLSHWSRRQRLKANSFLNKIVDAVYFVGRKRNLLFRKRIGTPLACAYCLNFVCTNVKSIPSRTEQVASETTPV